MRSSCPTTTSTSIAPLVRPSSSSCWVWARRSAGWWPSPSERRARWSIRCFVARSWASRCCRWCGWSEPVMQVQPRYGTVNFPSRRRRWPRSSATNRMRPPPRPRPRRPPRPSPKRRRPPSPRRRRRLRQPTARGTSIRPERKRSRSTRKNCSSRAAPGAIRRMGLAGGVRRSSASPPNNPTSSPR